MSAHAPTTIAIALPVEQEDLLKQLMDLNSRLLAAANASVWLTEEEAATRLKVSVSTLRKWRNEGWLRYYKREKIVLFKASELDADVTAKCAVQATLGTLMATPKTPVRR